MAVDRRESTTSATSGDDNAHSRRPSAVVARQPGRARFSTRHNVYRHFLETGDKVAADVVAKIMDKAALIPQERDARE